MRIKLTYKKTKFMKIREARSDSDYHLAYPLIRELFPHLDMQTYAHRVFVARATGYRMFVGEIGEDVIGLIGIMNNHNIHDGFVTYIEHVVVAPEHRNQGYGSKLIEFAEARAKEEGCHWVELDTDISMDNAAKLYKRSGYTQSGHYYHKNLNDNAQGDE